MFGIADDNQYAVVAAEGAEDAVLAVEDLTDGKLARTGVHRRRQPTSLDARGAGSPRLAPRPAYALIAAGFYFLIPAETAFNNASISSLRSASKPSS